MIGHVKFVHQRSFVWHEIVDKQTVLLYSHKLNNDYVYLCGLVEMNGFVLQTQNHLVEDYLQFVVNGIQRNILYL